MKKSHYSKGKMMTIVFVAFAFMLILIGVISNKNSFTISESKSAVMIKVIGNTSIYTDTKIIFTADRSEQSISNIVVKTDNLVCRLSDTINLNAESNFYRCNNLDSSSDELYLYIASNIDFVAIHDKENHIVYLDKKGLVNSEFCNRLPFMLSY
jgi:hypothetical protein